MVMQIRRTATANNPPVGLAQGQLAVEMASIPPKLWVGVPTGIDPTGRLLVSPQAAGGGVSINTTPPVNPNVGDLWFDPVRAQLYIWFDDGDSEQWVVTVNQPGVDEAAINNLINVALSTFTPSKIGVTDGSSAAPGEVGECIEYIDVSPTGANLQGYIVAVPTLPAGDWDISAYTTFQITGSMNGIRDCTLLLYGANNSRSAGFASTGFSSVTESMTAVISPFRSSSNAPYSPYCMLQARMTDGTSLFWSPIIFRFEFHARRMR